MRNPTRVFVIAILFISSIKSVAQNGSPISGYSYFDKKLYDLSDKRIPYAGFYSSLTQDSLDISLTLHANKIYTMWIKAVPQDTLNLYGGILIPEEIHYEFVDVLKRAKVEYEDLSKWAKENNISKYGKTLNVSFDAGAFYFIGKRWQTEMKIPLDFKFVVRKVNDTLRYILVVQTNHINLSFRGGSNLSGYSLFFQSPEEIESFIQSINTIKVNDFVSQEKNNNYRKDEFTFSKDSLEAYEKKKSREYARSFVEKHPFFKHFSWGIQVAANYKFAIDAYSPYNSPKLDVPIGFYGNYSFGKCFVRSSILVSMYKLFSPFYIDSEYDDQDFFSEFADNVTFDIPVVFGMNVLNSSKSSLKAKIMIGPDMRFFGDVLMTNFLTTKYVYKKDNKMILGARGGIAFEYKLFELGVNYSYFPEGNKLSSLSGEIYRYPMGSLNMTLGLRLFPK